MKRFPLKTLLLCTFTIAVSAFANFTPADSAKALIYCQGGSFIGITVFGASPDKVRDKAKVEIASNIISNIKSKTKMTSFSKESDGVIKDGITFLTISQIKSNLTLPGFKEIENPKRQKNGEYELRGYVCNSDVAKPYLEKLLFLADSLEFAANDVLARERPRYKNEAWSKTQRLYKDFIRTRSMLELLGIESLYPADEVYSKTVIYYKDYCRNAKLHWNPERETLYSEIAFFKLSGNIEMEKSPCDDKGISLAYKDSEPKCSVKFGLSDCTYAQSLSVRTCNGTEYLQLNNDTIMGANMNQDIALERLQNNLKSAKFWSQWVKEIKQWKPQCTE